MIPVRRGRYADQMKHHTTIGDAVSIASEWIESSELQFAAAFIGGSTGHADLEAAYDPASDIDCYLLTDGSVPAGKIGKILVNDVLLDITWLPWSLVMNAQEDAVMASLLHFGRILRHDGRLGAIQDHLSASFRSPEMISARLASMRGKIRTGLSHDSSHLPLPEQVMNWLFPATLATHIPLVAACAPLTVRKRFLAARSVMKRANYEQLLALYGFDTVTSSQARDWLDVAARLFDATAGIAKSSTRFWATDIHTEARHIAIDGSQRLIEGGYHREALYWIIATSSRCLTVQGDMGFDSEDFHKDYGRMLRQMGFEKMEDRKERSSRILAWIGSDFSPY
jgi:hypothetical protein